MFRLGIDLGGSKTEIIALAPDGRELLRRRVATPWEDYRAILDMTAKALASPNSTAKMAVRLIAT